MKKNQDLYFIDNVRGLSALLITVFHYFGDRNNLFLDNTLLENSAVYAGESVLIFFIVSGFVIPYALYQKNYKLQDYPTFLLKRFIRLHPPYVLSILLIVLYNTIVFAYLAELPFPYTFQQLALHLAYLNDIFKVARVNIVYWSLAIEFQYYLLVGLLFPLLIHRAWLRFVLLLILLSLTSVFKSDSIWITHYAHFFAVGMICNFYYLKILSKLQTSLLAIVLLLLCAFGEISMRDAGIMCICILLFLLLKNFNRYLHFLGTISYSLYLTHNYTGLILISYIRKRTDNPSIQYTTAIAAVTIALVCAYGFYLMIEKPSKRWAMSIKY